METAEHFRPGVILGAQVQPCIKRGINQIVNAIRPTLGPFPRVVAYDNLIGSKPPELLDDGGMIARRIIQLPDRTEDVGAMFLRQVLWRVKERVGDGVATTAVLFDSVYQRGLRHIAAGGDAMELRGHLEAGMRLIDEKLLHMTIPLQDESRPQKMSQVAHSQCHDSQLADSLGEIFKVIGEYGVLDIRTSQGRETFWERLEGAYWPGSLHSRQFETDTLQMRADLRDAAILISDVEVKDAQELLPILQSAIHQGNIKSLLVVVKSLPDLAVHLLTSEATRKHIQVVAVKTPFTSLSTQMSALEDLALLTGGRPIIGKAGQTLQSAKLEDLGRASLVWADRHNFGISGGQGDKDRLFDFLTKLSNAHKDADDDKERDTLQKRIGKLIGGSATLHIGGATETELETRKTLAQRTARSLRHALLSGVLPGGGVAFLNCRPALQKKMKSSACLTERAAYHALLEAVQAPFRVLLANAGVEEPGRTIREMREAGKGWGLDVRSGRVVNMLEAGILDVAAVQMDAVRSAIRSAALALTIETVVHKRNPQVETEP
jgi:chaperonin GroEL